MRPYPHRQKFGQRPPLRRKRKKIHKILASVLKVKHIPDGSPSLTEKHQLTTLPSFNSRQSGDGYALIAPPCKDGWMTLRPSTLINRYKTAVPPSVAPAHSLCLRPYRCMSPGAVNVSQAEARTHSEYLRLRIRADGEGDRLSRIRCPLAVRQGNQPDGRSGARHGVRCVDCRARRQAGGRDRT